MRKILVVTSSRADATPLAPVVKALEGRAEICGCLLQDTGEWMASEALAANQTAVAIGTHLPNLMLVLGDRYEILAACLAATVAKLPIAHIHGGEITRGSFDNQIRDAITKLSHVHLAATANAAHRLCFKLGEDMDRVHNVGAPGLDNLTDLPRRRPADRAVEHIVITYHPPTLSDDSARGARAMMKALDHYGQFAHVHTSVNNDPGAKEVRKAIMPIGHDDPRAWNSAMTPREYHRECRQARFVIGNSSSGVIEMPTIGVPSVNVGPRQDGREMGPSVFCCGETEKEIVGAIEKAIEYRGPYINPYGGPGASRKIADILTSIGLAGLLNK